MKSQINPRIQSPINVSTSRAGNQINALNASFGSNNAGAADQQLEVNASRTSFTRGNQGSFRQQR